MFIYYFITHVVLYNQIKILLTCEKITHDPRRAFHTKQHQARDVFNGSVFLFLSKIKFINEILPVKVLLTRKHATKNYSAIFPVLVTALLWLSGPWLAGGNSTPFVQVVEDADQPEPLPLPMAMTQFLPAAHEVNFL